MAISFHFREPAISDVIALLAFIIYLAYGIKVIRKTKNYKFAYSFLIGGLLGLIWFIINFFIPGIFLPAVPTQEEIDFTRFYGLVFNGLIQDIVLILSIGFFPFAFSLKNNSIENYKLLATGGFIQIIAVLYAIGPDAYGLFSLPQIIISGIAMAFFFYYGYINKQYLLLIFAATFFVSRVFLLIMV
jgi:hypothetical protein